jgi:alkanesulfonate monooxygenase SsuD/methylene tetrahydromethanopterin reductase-like flavin-dependent oxidoreductase (luciferase family)
VEILIKNKLAKWRSMETINEDRQAAFQETKQFLDTYYTTEFPRTFLENWVAFGSPQACIARLHAFIDASATTITLRITGYHQQQHFFGHTLELLPAFL